MFERIPSLPVTDAPGCPEYVVERDVGRTSAGKPEPEVMYWFRYTVVGKGEFPYDMLRRDASWPVDTASAMNIARDPENRQRVREVTLCTMSTHPYWAPTFDRWRSFGWVVKSDA